MLAKELPFPTKLKTRKHAMPQAEARHILVEDETLCAELKSKIQNGEDFSEVAKTHSGIIIASDQVATLDTGNTTNDEIFNKPGTHENAFAQLKKSSGKTVTFLTGIALLNTETSAIQVHVEPFKVNFKQLTDNQISSYLEKEDVLNCAGSFKSEGLGIALFSSMEGRDPNSLIGLPTIQLIEMLAKENVHIL